MRTRRKGLNRCVTPRDLRARGDEALIIRHPENP